MVRTALKRIDGPARSRPQDSAPRWQWEGVLLFIIAAVIAVPHISQATDSITSVTGSQIAVPLLFAAVALSARGRSQMLMNCRLKTEGSRPVEALDAALRQYVPDVVARQVNSGRELTSCECEISVLFVDIRGFTSFCEQHTPAEIFHMVNRFTERICQTIRLHGGHVLEFNGDGVMAVFGAPNAIVGKERAAVQAGCAILDAMKSMATDSSNSSLDLSVGVGIATGKDFVGNIQADRTIWTALGNTTNLASRLQNLTRDLHVAMAIDAATRVALEPCTMNFEHRRVAIRGRRDAQDVHVLAATTRKIAEEAEQPQTGSFCWAQAHPSLAAIGEVAIGYDYPHVPVRSGSASTVRPRGRSSSTCPPSREENAAAMDRNPTAKRGRTWKMNPAETMKLGTSAEIGGKSPDRVRNQQVRGSNPRDMPHLILENNRLARGARMTYAMLLKNSWQRTSLPRITGADRRAIDQSA